MVDNNMRNLPQCSYINQVGIRCGQPDNHMGQHGNGLLTTPRDEWHKFLGDLEPEPVKMVERLGTVYTEKSTIKQCLWHSPLGRCIYEMGHTLPHKEQHGKT